MCLSYFPFWAHAAHEETWHELAIFNILQLFACKGLAVLARLSVFIHDHRLLPSLFIDNNVCNGLLVTIRCHFSANLF